MLYSIYYYSSANGDVAQPFVLHECAIDKDKEVAHLNALSRILCYKLLPPHHDKLSMDLAIAVFSKQGMNRGDE